ncbi:NtaA/DmoA family FMN-dependent monooxygenase [Pseudonocardia sp. NPDC049635]|uniref:NtaA/DmoA family FMN-dependent monooxygenase n=1 Tax=Pseudonocardia sp. NPDC049635 TaxID=3155506 RepID=UPI0033EADADA
MGSCEDMTDKRPIRLGWVSSISPAGWEDDRFPQMLDWTRPEMYVEMTRVLESAGFDFVVLDDEQLTPDAYEGSLAAAARRGVALPQLDPSVLIPMLAAHTRSIGFVPTLSTALYPPFILARLVRTLDHLSDGRVGWRPGTTVSRWAARAAGLAPPGGGEQRERVEEYMRVVAALFASWEPDAVVEDPVSGTFADPEKVRPIDFVGQYYQVRGPLNVVPSPQYDLPVFHTVAEEADIGFAAAHADVAIVPFAPVEEIRGVREELRHRAVSAGRSPDAVRLYVGLNPLAGRTADAREAISRPLPETECIEFGLVRLSCGTGIDLASVPLDEPLDDTLTKQIESSPFGRSAAIARASSLREAAAAVGVAGPYDVSGDAEEIADDLERIADATACDGFVLRGRWIPTEVNYVANHVAAVLRMRGRMAPRERSSRLSDRLPAEPARSS